jgi:leucyl aminopeptidase
MQTSDALWERLHAAGETEYDRLWRLPLDEDYGPQIYSSNADLQNVRISYPLILRTRKIDGRCV